MYKFHQKTRSLTYPVASKVYDLARELVMSQWINQWINQGLIKSLLIAMVGIGTFAVVSCVTKGPQVISQRDPLPTMADTKVENGVRDIESIEEPTEMFVRQKEIKIRRKTPQNQTGSLTDLNDPRAYLFGFERPVVVGSYVDVKIASNRSDNAPATQAGTENGASSENSSAAPVKGANEADLLKSLPNLEPAGSDKPQLVKSIKMKVIERLDNGDAVVMYRRRSVRQGQGEEITVTARVTADALTRTEQITTSDLEDVEYKQSTKGDIVERKSANWEDEYSLRLSGFDETKSKSAMDIEDKREKLKEARDKLETEMRSFATERGTMAKERANLLDEKAKDTSKISELEQKSAELQKQLDEYTAKEAEAEKNAERKDQEASKQAKTTDKSSGANDKTEAKAEKSKDPAKKDEKAKTADKSKSATKPAQAKASDTKKAEPKKAQKKG